MFVLIKMLKNTKTGAFHPIFYMESPMPSESNEGTNLIRFKSKGHRTVGFNDRDEAISSTVTEVENRLNKVDYTFIREFEKDIEWDGESMPTSIEFRCVETFENT